MNRPFLSKPLEHYLSILQKMQGIKIGVAGDLVLDRYVFGTPRRLSRESPIPIIEYEDERIVCGGMANVTFALSALGTSPTPFGVIGKDDDGVALKSLLAEKGIDTRWVFEAEGYRTVTKTRVMAGGLHTAKYQVARIDRGSPLKNQNALLERIALAIERHRDAVAWLASDYGYGVVKGAVEQILKRKFSQGVLVIANSRYRIHEFSHITAVTLNEEEALEFGKCILNFETDVNRIGTSMLEVLHLKSVLITQGGQGMTLFLPQQAPEKIPVVGTTDIVDVSGAGDMVVTTFTAALAAGADFLSAAELANVAASIVVMKRGTAVAHSYEIEKRLKEVAGDGGDCARQE
ncbi:MAG: PfkB family carbohydrate kinase [Planctomycetota bacterium]|nr:PfkB family carbohydrate kinase [Planctomycetota bacterium]